MNDNKEQQLFINQPNVNGVLIGIPGGGKSTSIIHRIIHQVETCQIPPNGFIVVTFSRAAANDFRQKGRRIRPDIFDNDHIRTIHSLAGVIVNKSSSINSLNTVVYRATRHIRLNPDALVKFQGVKVVYVDEAQDISQTQYDLVCALGEALQAAVVLVGDADQALYAFQGGSAEFLNNHAGFRIELVKNYRSTHQIVHLANSARPSKMNVQPMISASGKQGATPRIISNTHDVLGRRLVEIVRDSFAKKRSVAIIGPTKKSGYDFHGRMRNVGLQWAYHILLKNNIAAHIHYQEGAKEGSNIDKTCQKENNFPLNKVHFFTIHGSKGLEFDTVVLLNFHTELMGFEKITNDDINSYKCLIYVGFTRAKEELWVLHRFKRDVWHEYADYKSCFELEGEDIPLPSTLQLHAAKQPLIYNWKKVLYDRKVLTESRLSELEDIANINVTVCGNHFSYAHKELPEQDKISVLYGNWAEALFQNRYRGKLPLCYKCIKNMIDSLEEVPFKYISAITTMYQKLGLSANEQLTLYDYEYYKQQNTSLSEDVDTYITNALLANNAKVFFHIPGITRFFDKTVLTNLLAECNKHTYIPSELIWKMCLFLFQYEYECKRRWYYDYQQHINALQPYEEYISELARNLEDGYDFNVPCEMTLKNTQTLLRGQVDCIDSSNSDIIELKFASSFSLTDGLQAIGYALMINPNSRVRVFNLRTQKQYTIQSCLLSEQGAKDTCDFMEQHLGR